jgi:hypothetical protein
MKKSLLTLGAALTLGSASMAQIQFDPKIEWTLRAEDSIVVPPSPIQFQVVFVGGVDKVQTTATYGNAAGEALAKEWHDFIGFTPDETDESLGWISVNHEMVVANDSIGDGGGMTVFRVKRDPVNDTLIIMEQTLNDGRSGKFFNVDFANTTGETGMNCGGIVSMADGRIWTAEEWWRSGNTGGSGIADRDKSDFVIGTGTVNGYAAPNGFPGFNGDTIQKFENYNYMTEIDPRQAVAIRKQYNWGRQPFEGGAIMPDNKTVYLGVDDTPGYFTKFVADNAGDFTSGKTYVYKHDANPKWIEIDNTNLDVMLNFKDTATALGATMYNRLEWVAVDPITEKVYIAETGRDNPAGRWSDEMAGGAVLAPHHISRAALQVTTADNGAYWDYYGRVLEYDPASENVTVYLEGGPYESTELDSASYVAKYVFGNKNHLSNPDGLGFIKVGDRSYMIVMEDMNGEDMGRAPQGFTTPPCEMFILDMEISNPGVDDLVRISHAAWGAEITGACATPDGKTILANSQHPATSNTYPYNHSLTFALTGFDKAPLSFFRQPEFDGTELQVFPNPASKIVYLSEVTDLAIYDITGKRIAVHRQVNQIDIEQYQAGTYLIKFEDGSTKSLIIK